MNLQLENLPNCITSLRVEVPADEVNKTWDAIAGEYSKQVKLPGYRPGKAPRKVVESRFKKEIKDEVQNRIVGDSVRQAIKEHNIRFLSVSGLDDVEFADDKSLSFTATIITSPSFDLPEYKGIEVSVPSTEVADAEIDEGLNRLREQGAEFKDVTGRPVAIDDFAVITYEGTIDGKPVSEVAPKAGRPVGGNSDFWIKLTNDTFLPGFSEKVAGAEVGENREFDVEVPADFTVEDLAGKTIHYSVTLNAIKEKVLPELDDAFAERLLPGKNLEELRDLARTELGRQKEFEGEQEKRNQVLQQLIDKVECELPESHVRNETHRVLTDLIQQNQSRGVSEDIIKESQQELLASASESARNRIKGTFVLLRIAEEEKIAVSRAEIEERIALMAARYDTTVDKLKKDLDKANAYDRLHEEILTGKVLDFLVASANVSTSAPEAAPASEEAAPVAEEAAAATE